MRDAVEVLREARALIADRKGWTQEVWVGPLNNCFCAGGAIGRAATGALRPNHKHFHAPEAMGAVGLLKEAIDFRNIPSFNDRSTHEEVLAAFDRAIALGESRR